MSRQRPHIVVIGDVLLDRTVDGTSDRLCPDAPVPVLDVTGTIETPGGAGLAALLCAETAGCVSLVAPVANDAQGQRLTELLADRIEVLACGHRGPTRTKTRVRSTGQPIVRLDQGGPASPTTLPMAAIRRTLETADAVLVSDYGAGITAESELRAAVAEFARHKPVVWDPHPRGATPLPGTTLATPNLAEARRVLGNLNRPADIGDRSAAMAEVARRLADHWPVRAVAVTAGPAGAFLADGTGQVRFFPAVAVSGGDPCGAGDRFAATVTAGLARRELLSEAVGRGVAAATAWVRGVGRDGTTPGTVPIVTAPIGTLDRGGPAERAAPEEDASAQLVEELARNLRDAGRSIVATGGCFDIVHAGHVATLQAARRLGDALVVLVNSDDSVRRLKGPHRPIVGERDRARVLQSLDCVTAVVVFDEDDPRRVLSELRPDVWVKGGDYGGTVLPESDVVTEHGGSIVFVPYLTGRSTSSIIERARTMHPAHHSDQQENVP
jgi:D-beta-D-heptose 7-phosphate kinase/D-beta-D-heptose 1-phosphate adenosyltransferase